MTDFSEDKLFSYNKTPKIWEGVAKIAFFVILISFFAAYFLNAFEETWITTVMKYVGDQVAANTVQGLWLIALFGGLFFVPMPLDVMYLRAVLDTQFPWLYFTIMLVGLSISYTINYIVGANISRYAKKIIPAQKFYATKSKLNQYGKWAILAFNILPLLPSQLLMLICGVFKYNKTRLAVIWIISWVIKLAIITQFGTVIANLI